jgi:predicted acyl esterase
LLRAFRSYPPSGESLRVSYGVLNLTHREGHEQPALLAIGERYRVGIQLNDAGSVFPPGHRVRLALSTAYWPMIWPSPEKATLSILGGTLDLPLRSPNVADARLSPFLNQSRLSQIGGASTDQLANNTGAGMDLAVIPGAKAEKKAAFSCLHKARELRRWQRRVDVPERALVLDLTRSEDEPAHGGAIE